MVAATLSALDSKSGSFMVAQIWQDSSFCVRTVLNFSMGEWADFFTNLRSMEMMIAWPPMIGVSKDAISASRRLDA